MKILTVVGARPNFVKAAMVSRAFTRHGKIRERILHTGQHYDYRMSRIFFKELEIPKPYKNLNVGPSAKGQAAQTAQMMIGIERECLIEKPDWFLIYGDTNSTLAGALAASKLCIPIAHVEAGLRSFNPAMPEEINRVLSDRVSDLLFAPTPEAVRHLKREGMTGSVHNVGDVMIDAIAFFRKRLGGRAPSKPYFVLTLHRQENVEDPERLQSIFDGLAASPLPFFYPVHPRTRQRIEKFRIRIPKNVLTRDPLSYLAMIALQEHSTAVWTDSGGVQKEAVVLGKRCYTLRDETEWVETVREGWNQVLGAGTKEIRMALKARRWEKKRKPFPTRKYYGDGRAAEKIARILNGAEL
jgi:UDP-GlcNAc3NAcA epimerase